MVLMWKIPEICKPIVIREKLEEDRKGMAFVLVLVG